MHTYPAFDIARVVTEDRVRAAEQHRLVRIARQARSDRRAEARAVRAAARIADAAGRQPRRPLLAAIFAH